MVLGTAAYLGYARKKDAGTFDGKDLPTTLRETEQPVLRRSVAKSTEETVSPSASKQSNRKLILLAQEFLTKLGHSPGPIDGVAGPRTRAAVRDFQAREGIAQTGDVTQALVDRLENKTTIPQIRGSELASTKELEQQQLEQQGLEQLQKQLTSLQKNYALSKEEFELTAPLAEKGMVSRVELMRLDREIKDLQSQIESTEIAILQVRKGIGPARNTEAAQIIKEQVCKAGIATVMNRDPKSMNTDRIQNDIVYISYTRANDGSHWAYKCKLEGNRIIWGSHCPTWPPLRCGIVSTGRWRTHEADSIINFTLNGNIINVEERFSDGSSITRSFIINQIPK